MALLSLKMDSGIVKGSKWPEDWAAKLKSDRNALRIGTKTTTKMGPKWLGLKWPGSEMA